MRSLLCSTYWHIVCRGGLHKGAMIAWPKWLHGVRAIGYSATQWLCHQTILIKPKILVYGRSNSATQSDVLMTELSFSSMKSTLLHRFCLKPLDKDSWTQEKREKWSGEVSEIKTLEEYLFFTISCILLLQTSYLSVLFCAHFSGSGATLRN